MQHGASSASDYEQLQRETDRLKTKNCNKMRTMDCNRNKRNSARSKQSLIRVLGPNMSKATGNRNNAAGELEE